MYVSNLHLENIRSFSNLEINLSKSINLLIGHNNTGKSTIIKSLYKLQNIATLGLSDVRKTFDFGSIFIDIKEISKAELETFEFALVDNMGKVPQTTEVRVMFGINNTLIDTKKGEEAIFYDLNIDLENAKNDSNVPFLRYKGLPSFETHNNFIYPFLAKRKAGYYNNQLGEKDTFSVVDDLRNITSKIQKLSNPSHPKNKKFTKYINDILGFDIGVIPHGDGQSNTGIYVTDTTIIPIDNMGEGVVNILGLIVMLLTENNKLYLIEELENDIHPKALKQLLELIIEKSTNNQFVISTHSNIVLKYLGIQSSKIFNLQWKPYNKTVDDSLPTSSIIEITDDPTDKLKVLDNLGYDILDFDLYKSYLILEESSAEFLVRDFLIPTFCPSLKDKIKTVAASGVGDLKGRLHDFLRLFVYIHQVPIYKSRAWIVADGDEDGVKNLQKLREQFPSWAPEHFINLSKKNIEEFYPLHFQKEFEVINEIKDKREKRERKIEFTNKLKDWITAEPEKAKEELSSSAAEIIEYLKNIESQIL